MNNTGVVARGIITPIFKQGDDIVTLVGQSVVSASQKQGFELSDGDIVGVTEAVVARAQGNYATTVQIAADVRRKFGGGTLGIIFPIMSRNRFAILLRAIAMGCDRLIVQMSYPGDEVGNKLVDLDRCDEKGINPYSDSFTEEEFRAVFGTDTVHSFTGVDYIDYYKSLGANIELVFSNDPSYILKFTKNVLCCDIHTRLRTKRILTLAGGETVLTLDDILNESVMGSGYSEFGLLGSNKATEDSVKLFPRETKEFVVGLQQWLKGNTGKHLEVMVYGDGGFKDPVGGIWELADPVISPAYTDGLAGTPNELKIKYLADNDLSDLTGEELASQLRSRIREKESNLFGSMVAEGTTPRRIFDLVGSLCDLVSGSGDRGTPCVLVQNYFKNFASE